MGSGHESQKMFGDVANNSKKTKANGVRKIEPQRFALKTDPPTIILEFKDAKKGDKLYLRRFTIKKLKADSDSRKVTKNLQVKCKEYLSPDLVATEQLERLVQRLIKNLPRDDEDVINISSSSVKSSQSTGNNDSENKNLENQHNNMAARNSPTVKKSSSPARTLDTISMNTAGSDSKEATVAGAKETVVMSINENTADNGSEETTVLGNKETVPSTAEASLSASPPHKKQLLPVKQLSPKARQASPVTKVKSPEKQASPVKAASPTIDSAEEEDEDNYSDFDDDFEDDFEEEEEEMNESVKATAETTPTELKKESPTKVENFDAENSVEKEEEEEPQNKIAIDGTVDLNRVSQEDLKAAKAAMDTDFLKNRVKPGDENYEFDKRVEFVQADNSDDDSWDESSEEDDDYSF